MCIFSRNIIACVRYDKSKVPRFLARLVFVENEQQIGLGKFFIQIASVNQWRYVNGLSIDQTLLMKHLKTLLPTERKRKLNSHTPNVGAKRVVRLTAVNLGCFVSIRCVLGSNLDNQSPTWYQLQRFTELWPQTLYTVRPRSGRSAALCFNKKPSCR